MTPGRMQYSSGEDLAGINASMQAVQDDPSELDWASDIATVGSVREDDLASNGDEQMQENNVDCDNTSEEEGSMEEDGNPDVRTVDSSVSSVSAVSDIQLLFV